MKPTHYQKQNVSKEWREKSGDIVVRHYDVCLWVPSRWSHPPCVQQSHVVKPYIADSEEV